jgi:hypothetical protein
MSKYSTAAIEQLKNTKLKVPSPSNTKIKASECGLVHPAGLEPATF